MIESKPTEFLGEMIARWDSFYMSNFDKIYKLSKRVSANEREAIKLTEQVFLHLLLGYPELILQEKADSIAEQIARAFPQLGDIKKNVSTANAGELLKKYYVPN